MQLKLKVTDKDTAYEVETSLYTVVLWERKFKRKAADLGEGIGYEDLCFFAYEGCKQSGITVPATFDDYIKRLKSVEVVEDTPANPSQAEATQEP